MRYRINRWIETRDRCSARHTIPLTQCVRVGECCFADGMYFLFFFFCRFAFASADGCLPAFGGGIRTRLTFQHIISSFTFDSIPLTWIKRRQVLAINLRNLHVSNAGTTVGGRQLEKSYGFLNDLKRFDTSTEQYNVHTFSDCRSASGNPMQYLEVNKTVRKYPFEIVVDMAHARWVIKLLGCFQRSKMEFT